jgi:hypothetical protein
METLGSRLMINLNIKIVETREIDDEDGQQSSLEIDQALSRDACVFLFGRSIKLTQSLSGIVFLVYLFFLPPPPLEADFLFCLCPIFFLRQMYCFERAYFFPVSIKTTEKYSEILFVITISIFMLSMLVYKSKLAKKKSTLSENLPRKKIFSIVEVRNKFF